VRFPVFLHETFRHSGSLSPLLHTHTELERALGWAVLQGHRLEDLLVIEFCETRDVEGLYRKYTAYVVGSEVIARTMGRGRDWMLKAGGVELSEEMLLEERAYVMGNPYEDQLRPIFELAGIEYGRIDFAVKDGTVETWEINTNPSVGPSPHTMLSGDFGQMRQPIRDHFSKRFHAALKALDNGVSAGSIPVTFSDTCLREASPIVHPPFERGALVRIGEALDPMRPLFIAAARVLSPLVSRVARGFR
jgi:hypothetical protein